MGVGLDGHGAQHRRQASEWVELSH
jgi:hypothetical protein